MPFCTVHWKLSDLFSIWCLVSQVFFCTHFLQPEPQYKHDTTHCFQRYWSQQNDLLLEFPSKNCVCLVSFAHLLWLSLQHARCLEQQHSFCQTCSYQCTMQEEFFLSLSKPWRTAISSLFSKLLISFGIPLRCNFIAQIMVNFFSNVHWAIITNMKYRSTDILDPSMEL